MARAHKDEHGEAKYPYTTKPGTLRKFLQLVPTKPKPPKVVGSTLKTWGFKDSNDATILRVLKRVGLLTDSGQPTEAYAAFMKTDTGPAALGLRLKETYKELFDHVASPERASNDELTNFFNIHSGGSPSSIKLQVQTFKALADSARLDGQPAVAGPTASTSSISTSTHHTENSGPALHIDLHIHLPESKSRSDYDSIFASIAEHILGKKA